MKPSASRILLLFCIIGLYSVLVLLEGRTVRHVYLLGLLKVSFCLRWTTVRISLTLLDVGLSFLLSCVALTFKGAYRVFFDSVVQLKFQFFVVPEVSRRIVRHVVDLIESICDELLFVVVGALQAVIVVCSVLDETSREETRRHRYKEEKQ